MPHAETRAGSAPRGFKGRPALKALKALKALASRQIGVKERADLFFAQHDLFRPARSRAYPPNAVVVRLYDGRTKQYGAGASNSSSVSMKPVPPTR